ncbi:MAG: helix-turn-helix domain-containing protein [Kurthia sp.]|nr:helix-turn-helix domain-containing protein [Candidatus Kurthia equi]
MIDIHTKLVMLRKKEQKTQQDIARFIGVSTAAVSKWETGQSYPDIMILPKLANYYNISIDDLLGYEPQLTKAEIQKLYHRLAEDFQNKPFKQVFEEIKEIVKEYYACFPLLMQLAVLLLNYSNISQQQTSEVFEYIANLCQRVEKNSSELKHIQLSQTLKAQLAMLANQPQEVLNILGEQVEPYAGNNIILAGAYQKLGQTEKAMETYQVSLFQNIISNMAVLTNYLHMQPFEKMQQSIDYANGLIDLFELEKLHTPSCISFYLNATHSLLSHQEITGALRILERYAQLIEQIELPITLHGNDYFNKIDEWIGRELDLGQAVPRSNETIRQELLDSVKLHPAFEALHEEADFKKIIRRISQFLGVN